MSTAVFLDFENVYLGIPKALDQREWSKDIIVRVLDGLGERPNVLRAYGNWDNYDQASTMVGRLGFEPIYTLSQHGKNSADLEMSLDIHEMLLGDDDHEHFVVISGDRDFIPISRRIVKAGRELTVIAFSRCLAQDLRVVAQGGSLINLDDFLPEEVLSAALDERYDLQLLVMRQVVAAYRKYEREIWLAPFFREWLNPVMPNASNDERKDIVAQLEALSVIEVVKREPESGGDERTYAAIIPNEDHPIFKVAEDLQCGSLGSVRS